MWSSIIVLAMLTTVHRVASYPNGIGVESACSSLVPQHGPGAQTTSSPYTITFTPAAYTPGSPITVTISGSAFKGFMIQARRPDDNTVVTSTFEVIAGTRQECSGNALVHSSSQDKSFLTFKWNAPSTLIGSVLFKAAFVQSKNIFWSNVLSSEMVQAVNTGQPNTPQPIIASTAKPSITTFKSSIVHNPTAEPLGPIQPDDNCGKTKGCFSLCANGGCRFLVTWHEVDNEAVYTLMSVFSSLNGTYNALGLSADNEMGEDAVIGCVHGSTGSIYRFTASTVGRTQPKMFADTNVILLSGSYNSGVFTCSLKRPVYLSPKLFDANKQWKLFFVNGPATVTSGSIRLMYHEKTKYISESAVSISSKANLQPLSPGSVNEGSSYRIQNLSQLFMVCFALVHMSSILFS